MPLSLGQGSGDFAETSGRVQAFHIGYRNSMALLASDGFTQSNPIVATGPSTTLAGITSVGVLGSSIAFTRSDAGNGFVGGPPASGEVPLGIFINDAIGNPFENTPGVASGRAPYYAGMGCFGLSLWETQNINSAAALVYSVGDRLFASKNGLVTNVLADNNLHETAALATLIGVIKVAPDADNSLMVIDLRI